MTVETAPAKFQRISNERLFCFIMYFLSNQSKEIKNMGYRLSIGGYQGAAGSHIVSRKRIIIVVIVTVILIIVAYIGGYLTRHARKCPKDSEADSMTDAERKKFYKDIADTMSTEQLRANLRYGTVRLCI